VIEIRLLGPTEVSVDGAPAPAAVRWKKHLGLLVYLACSRSERQQRDHLADLLWGSNPENARGSLNEATRVLRRGLGDDLVRATPDAIGLDRAQLTLDTDRLAELVSHGAWLVAAGLIRGPFAEGLNVPDAPGFEQWVSGMRARWSLQSADVLARAGAVARDAGDLGSALRAAELAVALDGYGGSPVRELMRVHALRGDAAAALAAYEEHLSRVREELDAMPEPESSALALRIRREAGSGRSRPPRPAMPFVGRARELTQLVEAAETVRSSGSAAVAVVYGAAGAGRTRLLGELAVRARLEGWYVAATRAVAGDEIEPAGTLIALTLTLLDAPGLPAADAAALGAFAARDGAWRERFPVPRLDPPPPVSAAVALMRAIAEDTPLMLALDDAHSADSSSLQALGRLLRDLASLPVFIVVTAPGEPRLPEIDLLAAHAGRDGPGVTIHLPPLEPEAVGELAAAFLPAWIGNDRDRLVRRLLQDGAGVPLLTTALLEAVRAGMELRGGDAAWPEPDHTLTATLPGDVPDSVSEAVRLMFRQLANDSQQVAAAASVLPERVRADSLARATGLAAPRVEAALDDLEHCGWLVSDARGYSFAARLVREIVARDLLTPGQRRRVIQRAASRPGPSGS